MTHIRRLIRTEVFISVSFVGVVPVAGLPIDPYYVFADLPETA